MLCARVVHEHGAHNLPGESKEFGATSPRTRWMVGEPKIRFVH